MPYLYPALQGVLNGAIGDTLAKTNNELAIEMDFYHQGSRLELCSSLENQLPQPLTNKLTIFVHGLTNTEEVWNFKAFNAEERPDNYGQRLHQTYDYTPFYLRYNTGLDIHENGQQLSEKVSQLLDQYPITVDEIVLIGFSMGGLVSRCAQIDSEASWTRKVRHCIYIGTPHEGAPLERFGHFTSRVFGLIPKPYFNTWEEWINTRSTGIKNLHSGLSRSETGFQDQAQHHFISGGVFHSDKQFRDSLIGDSLVQRKSAHPSQAPQESKFAHFDNLDHLSLAHSNQVYQQIDTWFGQFSNDISTVRSHESSIPTESSRDSRVPDSISHRDFALGSAKLALSLFDQTVDTVDIMHHSISDETYNSLSRVPLTNAISETIKQSHYTISKSIFNALRFGGKQLKNQLNSNPSKK